MSLFFLGLNPLFVSPRDGEISPVDNRPPLQKRKKSKKVQKVKVTKSATKPPSKSVNKSAAKSPGKSSAKKSIYLEKNKNIRNTNNTDITSPHLSHAYNSETSMSDGHETDDDASDNDTVYGILRKQRNDAIEYAQKLETQIKEQDVQFALKLDRFKQQLKKYKHTNDELQTENINLKDEIQKLEDRLSLIEQNRNLEIIFKNRKKIKQNSNANMNQLPNYVQKEFKKQNKQNHKKSSSKQINTNNTLPFIQHNRSQSESSSLSARAVNVSFPHKLPSITHIRQLTTILEHKSIPLELITNSDDNMSIHNEWNINSIAQVNDDENNQNIQSPKEQQSETQTPSDSPNTKEESKKNIFPHDDILQLQQSHSISYMSNNTIILNELSLEPDNLSIDSRNNDDIHNIHGNHSDAVHKNKPLLKPPIDDLDIDAVDNIIHSPINISSNRSFKIRL